MLRKCLGTTLMLSLCLATSFALGAPRGRGGSRPPEGRSNEQRSAGNERGGERSRGEGNAKGEERGKSEPEHGKSSPGGNWSQPTHHYGQSGGHSGAKEGSSGAAGASAEHKNTSSQATGAQSAAAGGAAANRNQPKASGAQGAAAGGAAANRNQPNATAAQGAAAGAAASNRNQPKATGAQGAAAGAAAANRNQPQYSGAQGAAAGAAVANRNQPQFSGAAGAAAGSAAVRNSYNNPNLYNRQWYGSHPTVWAPTAWAAGAAWTPTNWNAVAGYTGASNTPIAYNYGNNVVYQDGSIMVDGQSVGTAEEFSQQAADLAQSGTAADAPTDGEWLPLGVFAMVHNEQEKPYLILQLAINKDGIIRGNYTDEKTDRTQPIHGAVDPATQRAAWMVGNNKTSIMEAGLSNLADGEAPALIHTGGKTDHRLLVRLDQPPQN